MTGIRPVAVLGPDGRDSGRTQWVEGDDLSDSEPRTMVLYARIDRGLVEWIRGQSAESGLSMAQVTGRLLAWCRDQGAAIGAVSVTTTVQAVTVASTPKAGR